jgi:4-alpha-glucanotransferase
VIVSAAGGQQFCRAAGVAVPLFSLRQPDDIGSGEILDLIPFTDWLAHWHQAIVQLLPINETAPREASPYNTLSAFAIDPAYISAMRVTDVVRSRAAQAWLASGPVQQQLHRLQRARRRQQHAAHTLRLALLQLGFDHFQTLPSSAARVAAFERFCRTNGWWLDDYALFRALKERQKWRNWERWPKPLRDRHPDALAAAAAALQPRSRFFRYLQWIAAEQWGAVRKHARARGVLIKGDLPFVCGRDSADVWAHRELFDLSSSAGAPPDTFSTSGQAWGLPLYNWDALRRSGYEWWRQRARQARALYDLFRVDHVVGLYRTYAIPVQEGGTAGFIPRDEHEQLTQGHALLSGILEEAGTATGVIAEDLGTVPPWVRASLSQLGIPGYKVLRWERADDSYTVPRAYPPLSVATTGTHDTDTLVTWWDGLEADERTNVLSSLDVNGCSLDASLAALPLLRELHLAVLRRLYEAGSVLTIVPIQDLFGWSARINTPATVDRANWSFRLPVPVNALDRDPAIRERMAALRDLIDASGRWCARTDSGPRRTRAERSRQFDE